MAARRAWQSSASSRSGAVAAELLTGQERLFRDAGEVSAADRCTTTGTSLSCRATCRCSGAACWSRWPTPSPPSCSGLLIGLLVGLGRLSKSRLLNLPLIALYRGVPLHAAAGADRVVLLRAAGPARHPDPGDGGGGDDAVGLYRRVLCRDLPRRHHLDRARTVGRGAGAGIAALACDAARSSCRRRCGA